MKTVALSRASASASLDLDETSTSTFPIVKWCDCSNIDVGIVEKGERFRVLYKCVPLVRQKEVSAVQSTIANAFKVLTYSWESWVSLGAYRGSARSNTRVQGDRSYLRYPNTPNLGLIEFPTLGKVGGNYAHWSN